MKRRPRFDVLEVHVKSKKILLERIKSLETTQRFEQNVLVDSNHRNKQYAYFSVNGYSYNQGRNYFYLRIKAPMHNYLFTIASLKQIKRDLIRRLKSLANNFETRMQYDNDNDYYSYIEKIEIGEEC